MQLSAFKGRMYMQSNSMTCEAILCQYLAIRLWLHSKLTPTIMSKVFFKYMQTRISFFNFDYTITNNNNIRLSQSMICNNLNLRRGSVIFSSIRTAPFSYYTVTIQTENTLWGYLYKPLQIRTYRQMIELKTAIQNIFSLLIIK